MIGLLISLILCILVIMFLVFWIIMLVDSIQRKYVNDSDKIVWVLVNIFTGIIGALIYYFSYYRKEKSLSLKWFRITLLVLVVLLFLLFLIILITLSFG